jgi:DNA helicase-2/ATP-dependent DNA helicase PcrA
MSTKQWSSYQTAIFEAVKRGAGNLAINAVAGSGKTTTIVEAAKLMQPGDRVVFLAFNKHIVTELQGRLPKSVDCMTIHSLGMKACGKGFQGKLKVDQYKYHDIIDDTVTLEQSVPPQMHSVFARMVRQLVDLGRLTLTNFQKQEEIDYLIGHYDLAADLVEAANDMEVSVAWLLDKAVEVGRRAMKRGLKLYKDNGVIDFTDMLWLPYVKSLPVPRYDVVMVDEAQDLSKAQAEIAMRAVGASGRVIAVGDPKQSIMGFGGADNRSFANLIERTKATVLPLSVCYRCPTTHLALAREIVPTIEAAPSAIEGSVESIDPTRFSVMPRSGDLVICRTNAPLIGAALRLIGKGIQARVRGRSIGAQLAKLAEDASKVEIDPTIEAEGWRIAFEHKLRRFVDIRVDALMQRKHTEAAIEAVRDQEACIITYLEGNPTVNNLEGLTSGIEGLFADERASVWLSSIHRSKGLEADRVFVLQPDRMALTWKNQLDWQAEQEQNLRYVGLTRAKKALYFVDDSAVEASAKPEAQAVPA